MFSSVVKYKPGYRRSPLFVLLIALMLTQRAWALELEVDLEGVEDDLLKNVEAFLQIHQERSSGQLTERRMKRLHDKAPEQIASALQPFGYYASAVDAELQETGPAAWRARYAITPGPRTTIERVDFVVIGEAVEDPGFERAFGVAEGDELIHTAYEDAKNELLLHAGERGYLDARFERSVVSVDPQRNKAVIDIRFSSGPRYYFGPVRIEQNILDPDFVQRFVHLKRGEPYDQKAVLKLQSELYDADYFKHVEMVPVTAERDPETKEVPLQIVATENKRNKYRVGLGFATDVGPRVTFDWTRRWVTRTGHRASVDLEIAQKYQSLSGLYRIPLKDPVKDEFTIKPEIYRLDTGDRIEEVAEVDVARSLLWNGWRGSYGIQIRYEDYDIGGESDTYREVAPYIEVRRTVSDNPLYTTKGYRLRYELVGTTQAFGSTSNYLSTSLSAKWIHSFAGQYRFLTRGDLGATLAENIDDVPASRRFFAGGDQSIRGYGYDDLGPRDPDTGDVLGGRFLAVGSLELERKIEGDWSGALFYDFGNAFDPDLDNEFKQSAGIGARWRSPIGQIRLDLGVGLESNPPFRVHLVIGPDL